MAGNAVIGSLRVDLGLNSAKLNEGLKGAQSRMQRFGKALRKAILPATAAAGAALGGLGLAVRGALKDADDLGKLSQAIGVPIEELSALRFAAEQSGAGLQPLSDGLRRLSRNMADFAEGGGEARAEFEKLGISVTDAEGNLRSSTEVLGDIAERFAAMEDGAEKTAAAAEIFGSRMGPKLVPLLNQGRDGIEALKTEAEGLGLVIGQQTADNAARFNDNMNKLKSSFSALGNQLAERLAPHLADFSDWLVRNGPQIVDVVAAVVDFTAKAVDLGAKIAGPVIEGFRILWEAWTRTTEATQALIDGFNRLKDKGIAAVSEMVEGVTGWFSDKLAPALDNALAPIRALERGFAWLRDQVVGNSHVPEMIDGIAREFARLGGIMVPQAQAATAGVDRAFSDLGESITDPLKEAFKTGKLEFDNFREAALSIATRLRDQLLEQAFKPIQRAISGLFSGGGGGGGGILGGLLGGISGGGGGGAFGAGNAPFGTLGFQHGGSFQVGGTAGIDRNLVQFRATRGENVTIDPPGGRRGGGGNVYIDARGADQAAIARLEGIIRTELAPGRIERRAVNAVSTAQHRGQRLGPRG